MMEASLVNRSGETPNLPATENSPSPETKRVEKTCSIGKKAFLLLGLLLTGNAYLFNRSFQLGHQVAQPQLPPSPPPLRIPPWAMQEPVKITQGLEFADAHVMDPIQSNSSVTAIGCFFNTIDAEGNIELVRSFAKHLESKSGRVSVKNRGLEGAVESIVASREITLEGVYSTGTILSSDSFVIAERSFVDTIYAKGDIVLENSSARLLCANFGEVCVKNHEQRLKVAKIVAHKQIKLEGVEGQSATSSSAKIELKNCDIKTAFATNEASLSDSQVDKLTLCISEKGSLRLNNATVRKIFLRPQKIGSGDKLFLHVAGVDSLPEISLAEGFFGYRISTQKTPSGFLITADPNEDGADFLIR